MHAETGNIKGLYVHIPFCDGKCLYCAFYSRTYERKLAQRYLRVLETELKQYPRLDVETIYFGGGTPSLLMCSELKVLCDIIKKNISISRLKEWTIECNPRSITTPKLALLAKAGVNRISLGAQSFDDSTLKWLGRRHNVEDIYDAVQKIKSAGFENFSLDLIGCIPGFKMKLWRKTLKSAIALKPRHISTYALTREEGTKLAKSVSEGKISPLTEEEEIETLDTARDELVKSGYRRYEISNFAKPGFECLHNLACWRGQEYIGLGASAASHAGLKRWANTADLKKYIKALEQGKKPPRSMDALNKKLKQVEMIVFGLRMAEGISQATGKTCEQKLREFRKEKLVSNNKGRWRLTRRGFYLADYIGGELLDGAS